MLGLSVPFCPKTNAVVANAVEFVFCAEVIPVGITENATAPLTLRVVKDNEFNVDVPDTANEVAVTFPNASDSGNTAVPTVIPFLALNPILDISRSLSRKY